MSDRRLLKYASVGYKSVHGWLSETAIAILLQLGRSQTALGVSGPVCEIGVHHGKLFILLHLMTAPGELSTAWDLFERQDENIDQSGAGDRERLMANLDRCGCDTDRIRVLTANSLTLTPADVIASCESRPRFFSVDGGHTADITYNDLALAAGSICDGGLIVLDDFFNEWWPGVAEGACRFMESHGARVHPVVIAGNKFVFTNNSRFAEQYRHRLALDRALYGRRVFTAFGQEVIIFTAYTRTLRRRLLTAPVLRTVLRSVARARSWSRPRSAGGT